MGSTSISVEHPWVKVGSILGEGPIYDSANDLLHFVDITAQQLFHVQKNGEYTTETFEEPISCLAMRKNGLGMACTTSKGFAIINPESKLTYISKPIHPDDEPYTRFNDGGCDSEGRFFAGTLWNRQRGIAGKLYRFDPATGVCDVADEGPFTDSNGLGWSPDEKTFYFTDSINNVIYAYDYENGNLSNRRIFVDAIKQGFPGNSYCDGLCVDSDGAVWSARWGGSKIVRFTPAGDIDFQILFPTVLNVTSCCFGGPSNDQLFVTTAHCGAFGGDASRQEQFPDSGHLFRVNLSGRFKGQDTQRKFGA